MWAVDSPRRSLRPRAASALGLLLVLSLLAPAWAAEPDPRSPHGVVSEERASLFIALLKRRALQALEAHRPPPPPLLTYSTGLAQGYESNVNLDGSRQGDFFTQESANVVLAPRVSSWLGAELTYDLFHTHYADFRDANLFMNTLGATLQAQPHPRLRADLLYEYSLVNYPFDTSSGYIDHRSGVRGSVTLARWLTQRTSWIYQSREYDTRKARDTDGNDLVGLVREDQRHTVSHELLLRFPKTAARLGGQLYRNFSNDVIQDFYDWDDVQVQGVVSRVLGEQWLGIAACSYERRNYQARRVPAINVAERDGLLTLAVSLLYQWLPGGQLSYSLTYRYQDSNDPRLDFTDWINQVGLTLSY